MMKIVGSIVGGLLASSPWPVTAQTHMGTATPGLRGGAAVAQQLQQVTAELARQAKAARIVDSTPPVLERFRLRGKIDATLDGASGMADLTFSDDFAGVAGYYIVLTSPSGTQIYRFGSLPKPEKRVAQSVSIGASPYSSGNFSRFSEPGVWRVESVQVYDAAGNYNGYFGSDLAGFGNREIRVDNPSGFDIIGPVLARGAIGTPEVRLSKPPRGAPAGEGFAPYVYADLNIRDEGQGRVAGVYQATLQFCQTVADGNCVGGLWLQGIAEAAGTSKGSLRVGGPASPVLPPGAYTLVFMYLSDAAQNYTFLYGPSIGGTTDFGELFPDGTTITVSP